jgi:hypothetical protein
MNDDYVQISIFDLMNDKVTYADIEAMKILNA